MEKIVIIGGGGHAKVLLKLLKKLNFTIVGYVDITQNENLSEVKYLGDDSSLFNLFKNGIKNVAFGMGQVNLSTKRFDIISRISQIGFSFPTLISPHAVINEDVVLEEGVQILDGVVINTSTSIGKHTIINTNATVEHDCKIGKFCHIATGAVLSGGVQVGDFSMIGANSVVIQYKSITSSVMIGAGAVVSRDINESGTYVGVPARKI